MMMTRRVTSRRIVLTPLLAAFFALAFSHSPRADDHRNRAVEAGPEDGTSCCVLSQFLFHHDQVLVTTGRAGIFRSERRGVGWRRSMTGLVAPNGVSPIVDSLCQAPSDPRVVYALAGLEGPASPFNGLFVSTDFGESWTRRSPVLTTFGFGVCHVDPSAARTVYVEANNQNDNFRFELWKSTDAGATFKQVTLPFPASDRSGATVGRGVLYAADLDAGLFRSIDGGRSFQPVPPPPEVMSPHGPGVAGGVRVSPDGRILFVERIDPETFDFLALFRSKDGGLSYVPVRGLSAPPRFEFDPNDPTHVYTHQNDGRVYVSTDGGLTFSRAPGFEDQRFLAGVGDLSIDKRGSFYLTTGAGPFRTDDRGQTSVSLLKEFRASSVQDLAFDAAGELLAAVFHTRMVFRELHGRSFEAIGDTPAIVVDGLNASAAAIAGSPVDPDTMLVATVGQGLFRTTDGGRSWTSSVVAGSPGAYSNARMSFPTASRVYIASPGGDARGLYRSDDEGQTFVLLSSVRFGAIAADPGNPDIIYVGDYAGGSGLFKSTDGGMTLQPLNQPGMFSAILVDHFDTNVIYAGERFGGVLRSRDGGQTFQPANEGVAGAGVHGIVQDARGDLYLWIRGGGLFASDNGATTWKPVDTTEALERSGVEAGRGTVVADPRRPGRLYLGNASILRIQRDDCCN